MRVSRCLDCLRRGVEQGNLRTLDRLCWLRAQLKVELLRGRRLKFLLDSLHALDEMEVELCQKLGVAVPLGVSERAALAPTSTSSPAPYKRPSRLVADLVSKLRAAR